MTQKAPKMVHLMGASLPPNHLNIYNLGTTRDETYLEYISL